MASMGEQYFSDNCLEVLGRLGDDGLVITRDGVPYAKVTRLDPVEKDYKPVDRWKYYGSLRGKTKVNGGINGPVHPWDPSKFDRR